MFASVARRASASAVFAVAAFASVGIATSRKVAACPVASGQAASGQAASGKDGQEKGFEQAKDPKLDWQWERLPSIPNTVGVASPFAGVSHGVLLVAGGANFPDKKP